MVWVNAARYGVGLDGYGLPASLGTPDINPVRLWISAVAGALLILVSGYLLVQAWRTNPDRPPEFEAQMLPPASELRPS
jgi:hypothetical protein